MSMNIYAEEGTKVKGIFNEKGEIMHGTDADQDIAQRHLVKDKIYTVLKTDVHSWHTNVYLIEFPNIPFNSVHFEECVATTTFTLEDMKEAYKIGKLEGFEKCGQGWSTESFEKLMKEKYNIDINK